MKKTLLLFSLLCCLLAEGAMASTEDRPFITRWDLSKSEGSGATQISFGVATTGTVNYTWTEVGGGGATGAGTFTGNPATITGLPSGGVIDLSISPTNFNRLTNDVSRGESARLIEIKQWGTTAWRDMANAFLYCSNMTLTATDIPNTAAVTSMSAMFIGCSSFNQPLPEGFNTAAVTSMGQMFQGCIAYNQPLPASFNTEKVTNMRFMFSGATAFNQSLAGFQLNADVDLRNFLDNSGLSIENYDATLTAFKNSGVMGRTMGASGLEYCDAKADRDNLVLETASGGKGWTITDGGRSCPPDLFITRWDLSKSTRPNPTLLLFNVGTTGTVRYTWTEVGGTGTGSGSFSGSTAIISGLPSGGVIDLSISRNNFNRININNGTDRVCLMEIKQWGTTAWASMQTAFFGCSNMTLTATDVPNTAAVTNMSSMFRNCSSFNQALPEGFNTAAVTTMASMFLGCTSFNQPLPEDFNTAAVTTMANMFLGCTSFNQPLPTNLNTAAVTTMASMFSGATVFNQSLAGFQLNPSVNLANFLDNSGLSVANYDATLTAFRNSGVTGRTMGAAGLKYCAAEADKLVLERPTADGGLGWTITDGGKLCATAASGGTVAGSTTVCAGTNSTTLTLSGNTGNVVGWQSSTTENFATPTDIANTTTTLTATNLTQTTYFRAVVENTGTGSRISATTDVPVIYSTVATITVNPISVGGTVDGSTTVVAGSNSTTLTLSGQVGEVVSWQVSTSPAFSILSNFPSTSTSRTATNLSRTTYYRAVVQSGECPQVFSSVATITVTPASGGAVAGSTTVCAGTNSTVLTLSGNTGSVLGWQSSTTENFATPTNITNTTTTLTATNLTQTTYYRAVISSTPSAGTGRISATTASVIYSSVATIIVSPASVGGTVAGSTTVVAGSNSTTLTLSGQVGNVLRWQSSLSADFATPTDIANSTNSLTASNRTQTTYYRAVVKSGECPEVFSSVATITVTPASGGTVAGSTTVCAGTNSTTLTLSGQTGSVVRWESSTSMNFGKFTTITNTTTTLTATNLTQTTYYRAVISSTPSAGTGRISATTASVIYSSVATITVSPTSDGGGVLGSTTICALPTSDRSARVSGEGAPAAVLRLVEQRGDVVKWQSSLSADFASPTDIANTTTSLEVSGLTQTTYYRAVVQSGVCAPAFSLAATITVSPVSVGGSVDGSTTICAVPNSAPGNRISAEGPVLTLSGHVGNVLRWQSSLSADFATPTDIANTTTRLEVNGLTQTTYFRAVVQSGVCAPTFSSTATITVSPVTVGGSVAGSTTVVTGGNSTTLTLSGQVGNVLRWQSSLSMDFANPTTIANTTSSLLATDLTQTTYFRAVVQSGACAPAFSSTATITVTPASSGGSVAGSREVCTGTNSTTLTLSGQIGSVVKWQSSTTMDFASPTDIANTSTSLTATNLTQTTYYRAVVQSGADAPANSSVATVTVSPTAVIDISGNKTINLGFESQCVTLTAQSTTEGLTYSWSNGAGSGASVQVCPATTTTYTVTGTSAIGCVATASVTVEVVSALNCTQPLDQCSGNSFEIARYNLSLDGAGSRSLNLTYRSPEGNSTARIRINGGQWQLIELTQSADYRTLSIGSFALLNGTNAIEMSSSTGYMCFRQLCAEGTTTNCDFALFTSPSAITTTLGSAIALLAGCSGSGCAGINYQWSGNGADCATGACNLMAPATAGTYTYTVTGSKSGCTSRTAQVVVTVVVNPTVPTTPTTPTVPTTPTEPTSPTQCVALGDRCSGNAQEIVSFSLNLTAAGTFPLTLDYRSHESPAQGRIRVNGGSWQTFALPQTPADLSYASTGIGSVALLAGANTIEIASGSGYICFRQLCPNAPLSQPTTPDCNFSVFTSPSTLTTTPGGNMSLSASCLGSACQGVKYQWSGNGIVCSSNHCTLTAPTTEGTYTYTLTATKDGCASQSAQVVVTVARQAAPSQCLALGDQCSGNSQEIVRYSLDIAAGGAFPLTLTYRANEGPAQGRIRINGGSWQTFTLPQTPADLSYASTGIGSLTFQSGLNTIEFASGAGYICFRQLCLDVPVSVPDCIFSITTSPSTLTATPGSSLTLAAGCTGNGCTGISYQWSGNGANCGTPNCSLVAPTTPGEYTYTVTATKPGCTSQSAQVVVTVANQASPSDQCIALGDNCTGNLFEIVRASWNIASAGTLPLTLTYRAHEGASPIRIRINGGSWQTVTLPQTPANLSYQSTAIGSFAFMAGANTIELASERLVNGTGPGFVCFRQLCAAAPTSSVRMAAAESYEPQIRQLTTFPNPTQGEFTASFYVAPGSKADLMVSDMQGRKIWQKKLIGTGWQSERVSLPNAAAGAYILGLYTNTDSATPTLEFKRVLLIK